LKSAFNGFIHVISKKIKDEFSKWAKLRRKLDKAVADLEKMSKFASVL
jgi:hypothetical protein